MVQFTNGYRNRRGGGTEGHREREDYGRGPRVRSETGRNKNERAREREKIRENLVWVCNSGSPTPVAGYGGEEVPWRLVKGKSHRRKQRMDVWLEEEFEI